MGQKTVYLGEQKTFTHLTLLPEGEGMHERITGALFADKREKNRHNTIHHATNKVAISKALTKSKSTAMTYGQKEPNTSIERL